MGLSTDASTRRNSSLLARTLALAITLALTTGVARPVSADARAALDSRHLTSGAAVVSDDDWLGVVNAYRAMSNLAPLVENPTWSAEARSHSQYMLINGITHEQNPANPGYTEGGDRAGRNGNVATSSNYFSTERRFVELWMTGPFHAIGVLRHDLTATGFGVARDDNSPRWRAGATLDVLRGLNRSIPRRTTPTLFPGDGATVSVDRFVAEFPDPVQLVGWTGPAGLPLIAMLPDTVTTAQVSLTGPGGPLEVRALHPGAPGSGSGSALARQVMASENAVVIVPRNQLAPGNYTATVTSDGGSVTWSFTVDPAAPLLLHSAPTPSTPPPTGAADRPAPSSDAPHTEIIADASGFVPASPYRLVDSRRSLHTTRLVGGTTRSIRIGGPSDVAASINVTVVDSAGPGFLSVLGADDAVPTVSTVNFGGEPAANHVIATVRNGMIGLHSSVDAHVIVDVNGFFRPGQGDALVPIAPVRVFDSRLGDAPRLGAGERRTVRVAGDQGAAPPGATAVALNLTMVQPSAGGYLTVWPTGLTQVDVSNVNVRAGETRPNSTIVPIGADGTISVESSVATDLLIDVTGYLTEWTEGGSGFSPVTAIRLLDTRVTGPLNTVTAGVRLSGGSTVRLPVAGRRGVPADTRAIWVNVTAVDPVGAGFVTVFPGGNLPSTSTINTTHGTSAIANGALVALSDGGLSIYSDHDVHLLIDLTAIWR